MRVILLDNRDSFVYNLVDQFAVLGASIEVYRNTVEASTILSALEPTGAEAADNGRPMLCLSPGPDLTADDYDNAYAKHKAMGVVCYENPKIRI